MSVTETANTRLRDLRVNAERWTRKAVHNPTAFLVEIAVATLSLVLFSAVFGDVGGLALERAGFGDVAYVTYLLPAVLMQATMGSAFSSGMGLVRDLETGMFEKTIVTPMSATAVFAGKAAAELAQIVVQLSVVVGLAVAIGANIETGAIGVLGILAICLLVGLLFMAVSNIVGLLARDEEVINAATMLFMFPLLFLSPAFIPLSDDIELVATFNPITYGVEAVRALVLGEDTLTVVSVSWFGGVADTVVPAVGILLVLNGIVGAIAIRLLARASSASVA
ncbi:ABC-2 type transporter [Halorhabdus utahensis DSM 12940]|uniref:ABC-2 type transporter n=1 Tax=Halorhabdus utahensis (strain DSM 12940 / JCM 11049 / AX-2) TaxID=519442 RepID=C7NNB8_HALUD|nr:ABC transporter permease [Halorhabdus utahensis]ACV11518.1 ABC-2 type transporter [Halorhabdus utahensis DSM 12940]